MSDVIWATSDMGVPLQMSIINVLGVERFEFDASSLRCLL